jgi:arylsulfatase A-like enzyme
LNEKTNYLFILVDQARADFLGCYGNDAIKTPNIDALAKRGSLFERLYVANPFCMPARSAIMTGRMPSVNGARTNGVPLNAHSRTFVEQLLTNGYDTALIGKCHLQNMTGWQRAYTPPTAENCAMDENGYPEQPTRAPITGDDYENENSILWKDDPTHDIKTPYYGFSHVDLCTLHGDNVGANYLRSNKKVTDIKGEDNALDKGDVTTPQAWRTAVPEDNYPTAYIGKKAVSWLENYDTSKPFFLQCSFPDPHHPFTPPGKYWDMYDPDDIELPKSYMLGRSPILDHMRSEYEKGIANRKTTLPYVVSEKEAREAIALTYGMLTMIDDWIGEIVQALREQGLFENTIIIFASDHGDYMADHGIMLKGPIHTQGLIRTPFIWADPKAVRRSQIDHLCSAIDIGPTILEHSGTKPYYGIQGRSLLEVMADPNASHRNAVLIEDDREVIYLGFEEPQRVRTMVTEKYRISMTIPADNFELYDLENDPDEIVNLWEARDFSPIKAELTERMLKLVCEMQDWAPLPTGRA